MVPSKHEKNKHISSLEAKTQGEILATGDMWPKSKQQFPYRQREKREYKPQYLSPIFISCWNT